MAFQQQVFLGASVSSAGTTIGWNGESSSQLSVSLVEDPSLNQTFSRPDVGSPQTFQFGKLKFRGLIQSWTESRSVNGKPVFDVRLTDAREVLAGTQVIVNSYAGSVFGVPNILNVFGFFENVGFGFAGANDGGLPWNSRIVPSVRTGLEILINGPRNNFSQGLQFRGTGFRIDFTEMPVTPDFYRIGGNASISLLEVISQVCFDSGFDFFFELDANNKIIVKTVSRVDQPKNLNAVANFINQKEISNESVRNSKGRELRNEVATSFIVGGPRTTLRQLSGIPYWGLDVNGKPITGETPILNATSISDIFGGAFYPTTIEEMRFALISQDMWAQYLNINRPGLAQFLNVGSPYRMDNFNQFLDFGMAKNDDVKSAEILNWQPTDHQSRIKRVYDLVHRAASEFYGKQFLVPLSFITIAIEAETLRLRTNEEVTESAFEGVAPISGLESLLFKTDDGRFETFVRFGALGTLDLSNVKLGDDAIIQNGQLFLRCSVDPPRVIFKSGLTPYVTITLPDTLYERSLNIPFGNLDDIAKFLTTTTDNLTTAASKPSAGQGLFSIHPRAFAPNAFFIPFQNNSSVYGPFASVKTNNGGKVNFQVDSSLVPWNFAGFDNLNIAGKLLAEAATTGMIEAETGDVELAGEPIITLGEALVGGGPNVTSIALKFGADGVTTTYNMQTFTPKFGLFSKSFIDRIRRLSSAQQDFSNNLRNSLRKSLIRQAKGAAQRREFLFNLRKGLQLNTMSRLMIGAATEDKDGNVITVVTANDAEQAIGNVRGGTKEFGESVGFSSLETIFRPFATDFDFDGKLAHYEAPDTEFETSLTLFDMDPFQDGHDAAIAAQGTEMSWEVYSQDGPANLRPMCLKGPMVVCGWGHNLAAASGSPTDPQSPEDFLGSNFLRSPKDWKTGPVDLLWDDKRKVWTSHGHFAGTIDKDIDSKKSGTMTIFSDIDIESSWKIKVHNFFSSDITVGDEPVRVHAQYNPYFNKIEITAVDCVTGTTTPTPMKMAPPTPMEMILADSPDLSAGEWDRLVRLVGV